MDVEDRYARHRLIEGWDQERLAEARVLVAGAGAIGNAVVELLALFGFGHVLIVDFDTVEMSNLTRSPLFRDADIGRPKAIVAADRARDINPSVRAVGLMADLAHGVGLGVFASADVVIGCLDSLDARLSVNRACMQTGTPWLNGAIEATVAEVSLFRNDDGACFECGMSASMWARRGRRASCTGLRTPDPERKAPTTAVGAGLAAAYLVQEALSLILADSPDTKRGLSFGQKVTVNLQPYETGLFTLARNPECLAHEKMADVEMRSEPPSSVNAANLLAWSGPRDGVVELGFDLATELRCTACGASEPLRIPLERCDEGLVRCPECGAQSRCPESISWLDRGHSLATAPLADLGVPEHQILCVKNGDDRRYYQLGGRPIWT